MRTRSLPLEERKPKLRGVVPSQGERLLYSDHMELPGEEFFWLARERDLEGIVAKRRFDPYLLDGSICWYKIRNRNYSQWVESVKICSNVNATVIRSGSRGTFAPQHVRG